MALIKSAKHHWWPETLSQYWRSPVDGFAGWLRPDGSVKRIPPKHLGLINNGHTMKLGEDPDQSTFWDTSYESDFDLADTSFPKVITWLNSLTPQVPPPPGFPTNSNFVPMVSTDDELRLLVECLVSLAVRSPRTRNASVLLAEDLRGELEDRHRHNLIGFNLRGRQQLLTESIDTHGKFVKICSSTREFIFGDGFYHNLTSSMITSTPKIFVPLTPTLALLYVRPMQYNTHPKLMSLEADSSLVDELNIAIHVHSKDAIFFRSEQPRLSRQFNERRHYQFADASNPVDRLIASIPGTRRRSSIFSG